MCGSIASATPGGSSLIGNTPKLRINARYAALARKAPRPVIPPISRITCRKRALVPQSLQNRNETLLKVATCIVERQREFLERGDEYMKPLILRDIAEALGMHESTISRVTTQKYLHTPRGFPMNSSTFFQPRRHQRRRQVLLDRDSRHDPQADPGGKSRQTAQRQPHRAELLGAEGFEGARRTVAKYREAMAISSSSDRKRLV